MPWTQQISDLTSIMENEVLDFGEQLTSLRDDGDDDVCIRAGVNLNVLVTLTCELLSTAYRIYCTLFQCR